MLGANLVCFQVRFIYFIFLIIIPYFIEKTYSYCRDFLSTCIRVCGYETNSHGIDVNGHVTAVMYCPVGIDAERVGRDMWVSSISPFFSLSLSLSYWSMIFSKRPGIIPKLEALRTLYEGKKIIVGRDKLDVVKGVLQKVSFLSFSQPKNFLLYFYFYSKLNSYFFFQSYEHSKNYFTIIQNGLGTSSWSKWPALHLLILPSWRGWWVRLWRI